jgi:hypothetical protein
MRRQINPQTPFVDGVPTRDARLLTVPFGVARGSHLGLGAANTVC